MKKTIIAKTLSITLATIFASSLCACDLRVLVDDGEYPKPKPRPSPNPDPSISYHKTQLKISNDQAIYGREWLDYAIARFEKEYQNYDFEPGSGKKGIHIHVDSSINGKSGYTHLNNVPGGDFAIHFTSDAFYYDLIDLDVGADITDIVTETLPNETRSIEDKMEQTVKDFFGVQTGGGTAYYALPHYFTYHTLSYDVDIFDAFGLWLKADGTFLYDDPAWMEATFDGRVKSGEVKKEDFNLSKGIDGDNGTEFDGLPATYDEFFALLDKMLAVGVEPIHTFGSGSPMNGLFYSAWAQNEGRESFLQTINPAGTSNRLIQSIADDGEPILSPANTTVDDYNVVAQLGNYQALQFAKRLTRGTIDEPYYFHDWAFSPTENNISAEGSYLYSKYEDEKPIALYMSGIWWENEAAEAGYFWDCEDYYGEGRYERRFGVLPVPFADASYLDGSQKWTMASNGALSLAFINKKLETDPSKTNLFNAAKMFLQFLHTDEELQNFSVQTGGLKLFNYDIPEQKLVDMSYYGKQVVSLAKNPNVDIVYTISNNQGYINNYTYYNPVLMGWSNFDVMREFFYNPELTAAEFFWQMKEKRNLAWDKLFE